MFRRQIEAGGPVTVTHRDAIRYFMSIPEAAALVIQAGAMATGGDVFVLDMDEPVKIDDLAKSMIHLMGLDDGCRRAPLLAMARARSSPWCALATCSSLSPGYSANRNGSSIFPMFRSKQE